MFCGVFFIVVSVFFIGGGGGGGRGAVGCVYVLSLFCYIFIFVGVSFVFCVGLGLDFRPSLIHDCCVGFLVVLFLSFVVWVFCCSYLFLLFVWCRIGFGFPSKSMIHDWSLYVMSCLRDCTQYTQYCPVASESTDDRRNPTTTNISDQIQFRTMFNFK